MRPELLNEKNFAEPMEQQEVLGQEARKLLTAMLDTWDTFFELAHVAGVDDSSAVDQFTEIRDRLEESGFAMIVVEPREKGMYDCKRWVEGEHKGVMVKMRANNGYWVNIAFYGGFSNPEDAMRLTTGVRAIYDGGVYAGVEDISLEPTIYNLRVRSGEEVLLNVTMEILMNAKARVMQMTVRGKRSRIDRVLESSDFRYPNTAGKMHDAAAALSRMVKSV